MQDLLQIFISFLDGEVWYADFASPLSCRAERYSYCSLHVFTYIRGWMQMVLAPNDLFSWNNNTMSYILTMDMLHYCCLMHNDTYSVHDRSLKPWWSRLPCLQSFCYVFSPPLSGLNWRLTSLFGGPGPPTPKMASPLLGSPHTPFPGSGTVIAWSMCLFCCLPCFFQGRFMYIVCCQHCFIHGRTQRRFVRFRFVQGRALLP